MKRLLLLLCIPALMQTKKSFSQDSISRLSILISPAVFVPVTIAAQGGLQYRLSPRWSILAEAAFPTFHPTNTEYEKIRYWRTGIEVKHYTKKKDIATNYVSFQTSYLFRKLEDKQQGFYYAKSNTITYNNAVISSPVLASAIKLGVELSVGKRIFADIFFGAGARLVFNKYESETALLTSIQTKKSDLWTFDNAWGYNYTVRRLHATGGLRMGLRL